ncbi:2-C-methyl-D-erythritol 4-phosphate cytidylyltransferase [Brachybacterium alimentarium]|uniref:2-C-methyl-D-erythritol 4-phosphate cytidylyltransferase n=1 Tax=Brachybacterium alimentarium TaxID=47845 RepID=UPI0021614592|nr:2-C-methyl-D-erythritol 4-phosphate cytidylyltransferase [Brachybacterium alimentarium]
MTSVTEQTVGAVRPIVLALAPPAPGLSEGVVAPCLEAVGGARLIERLLDTLAEAGLVSPLVISSQSAAPALRALLGERARVLPSSGGRRGALALALAEADEDLLLLHDAERALTPVSVVSAVLDAVADEVDAVLPVAALTDSVKAVHAHGLRNIDRSTLAGMQSPRLLRRTLLERALAQPGRGGLEDSPDPGSELDLDRVAARGSRAGSPQERYDEILAALDVGARARTVHGSHSGFAVLDRLSLWQAQISLGLARDTSHRHGLARQA